VKHEWSDIPKGWVEVGRPSPNHSLKINFGLKQDRFDELLGHLYEVSDPGHHRCAFIHASLDRHSLTPPERPDMETTSRRRRLTN